MPQPIRRRDSIHFSFAPDAIADRPKLAPYIGVVSAYWNDIEARTAVYMAALLKHEAQTVISIYLALTSDHAKRATLDTVIDLKLGAGDKAKFKAVMTNVSARYKERNKVVHGSWGTSPEYPDDLLWYDPKESTSMFPEMMALSYEAKQARLKEMQKSLFVWKGTDFTNMIDRFKITHSELLSFTDSAVRPWMNLRAQL